MSGALPVLPLHAVIMERNNCLYTIFSDPLSFRILFQQAALRLSQSLMFRHCRDQRADAFISLNLGDYLRLVLNLQQFALIPT